MLHTRQAGRIGVRWALSALVTATVVGTLASCSILAAEGPVLSATPATTETADPPYTGVRGSTPSLSPAPQLTAEKTRGLESTPWVPLGAAGTELTIKYVAGGGCSTFAGIRVHETETAVEIWTAVKTDHAAQACAAYLKVGATRLQLEEPLGDRNLLHAPISPDWKANASNF